MKDKNKIYIKKNEDGYILAFALVVVSILLLVSLSVSRIVSKEIMFSKLIDYNRGAYFAANSGLECAQYIENIIKDDTKSISLFLNSVNVANRKEAFETNARENVFFATTTVKSATDQNDIFCASDDIGYNRIFKNINLDDDEAGYVNNREEVINNLNNKKSSYTVIGDYENATTTFGFIVKGVDTNEKEIFRCVIVDFAKTKGYDSDISESYSITSTGISSCNPMDMNRVSRTIHRFSKDSN